MDQEAYELWRDEQDAADGFDGLDNEALVDVE